MKRLQAMLGLTVASASFIFFSASAAGRSVSQVIIAHGEDVPLPAYRWVHTPPNTTPGDKPAEGVATTLNLAASDPQSVASGDGQCTVIFKEHSVAPKAGESAVHVKIVPVDAALVAQAPSGKRFDSNAYRIEGTYAHSGAAVVLRGPVTVFMRAATGGTDIVLRSGAAWTVLQNNSYPLSVMTADTRRLGTFAVLATGPAANT